jgi:hypothetical protein
LLLATRPAWIVDQLQETASQDGTQAYLESRNEMLTKKIDGSFQLPVFVAGVPPPHLHKRVRPPAVSRDYGQE